MSTYIQVIDKTGRHNDPRFWAEADVIAQPVFNLKKFQKRIDAAIGTTRDRQSIVRVRWAWSEDCYSMFFTDWDASAKPVKSTLRAKYVYKTVEIDSETRVDICPPRFVFEERIEPAQYYAAWEQNRWQWNHRLQMKVPVRPRAPRDGYYTFLYYAAAHDPESKCCDRAAAVGAECFGVYCKPGSFDLNFLGKLRRKISNVKKRPDPYKPLGTKELADILADSEAIERDNFEKKQIKWEEDRKEYTEILKPQVAYSLPGEKISKGGIILPG